MRRKASHIARQLHLNRSTVSRWLNGETFPTGLSAEALKEKFPALYKELEDGYKKRRACDQESNP